MKPETKLTIRRWSIRQLRKLLDFLDDRLHAAEVRLREDIAGTLVRHEEHHSSRVGSTPTPRSSSPAVAFHAPPARAKASCGTSCTAGESFQQWEARRSGVAPVRKKSARRRGMPARAFDLRFSTR